MELLNCKLIEWNSMEYQNELDLRNRILRLPLGLNLYEEDLSRDKSDIHFGIFRGNHLLGTAIFSPFPNNTAQVRQVAVESNAQNQGLGKKLILFAEEYAKDHAYKEVWLNARMSAFGFYQKLAYHPQGDVFLELTIPHQKMIKLLF